MKELNYKQLMFAMNISEERALHTFVVLTNKKDPESQLGLGKKILRDAMKGRCISVSLLSAYFERDIEALIADINTNFWRDQVCMTYLEQHFNKKFVRNDRGFLPMTLTAPTEVTSLMNEENIKRLEEWFDKRYIVQHNETGDHVYASLRIK